MLETSEQTISLNSIALEGGFGSSDLITPAKLDSSARALKSSYFDTFKGALEVSASGTPTTSTVTTTTSKLADLTISSLSFDSTSIIGSTPLQLSYTIKNQGSVAAGNSTTNFYLSSQSTLDSTATLIGSDSVGSLDTGKTQTDSLSLTLDSNTVAAGNYYIIAQADSTNNVVESNKTNNTSSRGISYAVSLDSFTNYSLKDTGIKNLTSSLLLSDGSITRNDIVSIFRETEADGVITADELTDLRTIVNNGKQLFGMADYVYVLANDIVNGNVANTTSTIGNLAAGSTGTQMEKLINKWFFGSDHPIATGYTYKYATGSLFGAGISPSDITQGSLGDCYFLSTLSSTAQKNPSAISNMFIDNGDNTYTVRFFNNGQADYVTVDKYIPTNFLGQFAFANYGQSPTNPTNLWVAIAEKAYAQLAELGWSRTTATNSYSAIAGGWMNDAINQVTNLATVQNTTSSITQSQLIDLVNSNKIVTAGFVSGLTNYSVGYGVVNNHAYSITSYNPTTGTFHLHNPWNRVMSSGYGDVDLTYNQLGVIKAYIVSSVS